MLPGFGTLWNRHPNDGRSCRSQGRATPWRALTRRPPIHGRPARQNHRLKLSEGSVVRCVLPVLAPDVTGQCVQLAARAAAEYFAGQVADQGRGEAGCTQR